MFLVMTIVDNILGEIHHVGVDRVVAQDKFLGACAGRISNWDEYSSADIEAVLDQGYEHTGCGAVMLVDTDGFTSNDEIAAALGKYPPKSVQAITEWLCTGEIGEAATIDEMLKRAGRLLDKCESHEICGEVVFVAEDGKTYVLTVEAVVAEANPDYLKALV